MDNVTKAQEVYNELKKKGEDSYNENRREMLINQISEEKLMSMVEDMSILRQQYVNLIDRVMKLEGDKIQTESRNSKDVYTINEMYFVGDYEYKGKNFASFMVRLEGDDTLYTWDRVLPIKNPTTAGDLIYCEIDGNSKLRNVKSLQNI
jgi:hypothetical protein